MMSIQSLVDPFQRSEKVQQQVTDALMQRLSYKEHAREHGVEVTMAEAAECRGNS
jgi:hypothetical protein